MNTARELLASRRTADWDAAADGYGRALAALAATKKKPQLVALDAWMRDELPAAVAARHPPHVTQPELARAIEWKMTVGKVRPNLAKWAAEADARVVADASTRAFAQLAAGDFDRAFKTLTDPIKGTGPAAASALLAL